MSFFGAYGNQRGDETPAADDEAGEGETEAYVFRCDGAVRFVIVLVVDQHVPAEEAWSYDGGRSVDSCVPSGITTVSLTSQGCSPLVSGLPLRKYSSPGLPEHRGRHKYKLLKLTKP